MLWRSQLLDIVLARKTEESEVKLVISDVPACISIAIREIFPVWWRKTQSMNRCLQWHSVKGSLAQGGGGQLLQRLGRKTSSGQTRGERRMPGFSVCLRNSWEHRSQPGREEAHSHFSILSTSSLALDGIMIPEILGKVYICLLRRWYKTPLRRDVEKQNAKDMTVCWKHSSICGNWLSCQCYEPQVSALKRPVLERWSAPCQYILFKKQPGKKFRTEFLSKLGAPKVTLGSGSRCRGISSGRFLTEPASPGWDNYSYIDTLTLNHMFTDLFLLLPSL